MTGGAGGARTRRRGVTLIIDIIHRGPAKSGPFLLRKDARVESNRHFLKLNIN